MIKQMGHRDVEKCAHRNLMKFSKGKCRVLNVGRKEPMHQEELSGSRLAAQAPLGIVAGRH